MIAARDLSFRVQDTQEPLLRNIDLDIRRGERVALVGPSGSGKTTLALHLAGLHRLALSGETSGHLTLEGRDCVTEGAPDFAGIVLQNPESQLFSDTPETEIELSIANRRTPCVDRVLELERFFALLGLNTVRTQPLKSLSMGWKQRVSIVGMLAMCPDMLVLDEPTNYLDGETADELFAELRRQSEEQGLTVLVVEHDLERVLGWATRVLVLEKGTVIFDGSPEAYAVDRGNPWKEWTPAPIPPRGAELARLEQVTYGYSRQVQTLSDISLTIHGGEIVAVTGPNGAGKSTLLHVLKGILAPHSGVIEPASADERLNRFGLVCQNPDDQIFAHSVFEECAFLLRNFGLSGDEISMRTERMLRDVGLGGAGDRFPFTLSYGEKRRLSLASVLVGGPCLVCLDEPTVGLDVLCLRQLARLFEALSAKGSGVVFATHDRHFAEAVATRIVTLNAGRIIADTPCRRSGGSS